MSAAVLCGPVLNSHTEGRRRLDQRGLAHRLRRHRGERAPPHPRLQAARHGGPGALRPRHGRRSRGWARRALRRCPRQGPTGHPHRHRDHLRPVPFFTHHLHLISLAAVIGAALPVAIGRNPGNLTSLAVPRLLACCQ
jgi:hypothetical protein